jgi:hypothetical protein
MGATLSVIVLAIALGLTIAQLVFLGTRFSPAKG